MGSGGERWYGSRILTFVRGGLNCDEILIALGGLHKKHVMQNGTWEPIKHFL